MTKKTIVGVQFLFSWLLVANGPGASLDRHRPGNGSFHRRCRNLSFSLHYQGEGANFPGQFLRLYRPNHCSNQTMGIAGNYRWLNQRFFGIFCDERISQVAGQETAGQDFSSSSYWTRHHPHRSFPFGQCCRNG